MNLENLSHGDDGNIDRQEIPKCQNNDIHDRKGNKEYPSENDKEKEE